MYFKTTRWSKYDNNGSSSRGKLTNFYPVMNILRVAYACDLGKFFVSSMNMNGWLASNLQILVDQGVG